MKHVPIPKAITVMEAFPRKVTRRDYDVIMKMMMNLVEEFPEIHIRQIGEKETREIHKYIKMYGGYIPNKLYIRKCQHKQCKNEIKKIKI